MVMNVLSTSKVDEFRKPGQPYKLHLQYFNGEGGEGGAGGGEQKTQGELIKEIKNATAQFATALKQQEKEMKEIGTTSDKTKNTLEEYEGKYEALEKDLKAAQEEINKFNVKLNRPGYGQGGEGIKTAGQLFTEDDQVKQMMEAGEAKRGVPISVKSFYQKDLTSGATSGGALIDPYRVPEPVMQQQRRLTIRQLLNATPITSNAVEFVRETGFTNNANIRAEGAAAAQSEITFELQTQGVKNISHFMPASREVLNDAPRLRSIIDNRLTYGVQAKEEGQLLYGDGVSGNMLGFMNDPDVQDLGEKPFASPADYNHLDHIRKAITKSRIAEYMATGIVLNPENWEEIELLKGSNGHYIWLNVGTGNDPKLFKVPVIDTTAVAYNDFLTGAFGLGATLYDREQASVRFSESHSDYFTRGMVAILGEERVALTIERPEAFVKGKLSKATA